MSTIPNTRLAAHLTPYLEQIGNDACNAEDQGLWDLFCAMSYTQLYLREGHEYNRLALPSPSRPPWSSLQ